MEVAMRTVQCACSSLADCKNRVFIDTNNGNCDGTVDLVLLSEDHQGNPLERRVTTTLDALLNMIAKAEAMK
jgi:hypothetical protein